MSFQVEPYTWQAGTRPCTFTLALDEGSVFADFDVDPDGYISLLRVSFDGYGAWQPADGQSTTVMEAQDAAALQQARNEGTLNSDEVRALLRRYFNANRATIWSDALAEYGLLIAL